MADRTLSLLLGLAILLPDSACNPRGDVLRGQMFIVTESRTNVRLGLVTVELLRRAAVERHLAARRASAERLRAEKDAVSAERDKRIAATRLTLSGAQATFRTSRYKSEHFWEMLLDATSKGNYAQVSPQRDQIDEATRIAGARVESLQTILDSLLAEASATASSPWDSSGFYVSGLPEPIIRAQTDADGEFTMRIPARGDFVLVARAERYVPTGTEQYCWVIVAPQHSQRSDKLLLSNETLTTENAPISILHTLR